VRVTSKGQVTIPLAVREAIGIRVSETEIEFIQDKSGRWYLRKLESNNKKPNRFRNAHKAGKIRMSTEELLELTRGD
jgi:AbrB family looped-hinge helix DNA binding protein